jgi:hypothetical protein
MNLVEWREYEAIQNKVQKGKATFIAMIPMEEFLDKEIAFSRVKGKDLIDLKAKVRKLLSGLGMYFYSVSNVRRISLLVLFD